MKKKKTIVVLVVILVAVVALLSFGFWFFNAWLPRKVGAVITERFGEHVRIGAVHYVFPLGVDVRDVVLIRKPGAFFSGEAARVRVKIRPSAVFLLRWDARLLQEVKAADFTLFIYPPQPPFKRPAPARAAVAGVPNLRRWPSGNASPPAPPPEFTPPSPPAPPTNEVKPAEGRAKVRNKMPPCDFTFKATRGRVVLRREREDNVLLRDVDLSGRVTQEKLDVAISGATEKRGTFKLTADHSFAGGGGSAEYQLEAVEAAHVLAFAGKPRYLLEADGVMTFTGWVNWRAGKIDHRATGRLSRGRLVLAPGPVQFTLEDVTLQFSLHNAAVTIDEGSCRAAEVRWAFSGTAAQAFLDLTFRSESMTLQNLVNMFAGGVAVSYAGVGTAEFRIAGTPQQPEFYLRVARTDTK